MSEPPLTYTHQDGSPISELEMKRLEKKYNDGHIDKIKVVVGLNVCVFEGLVRHARLFDTTVDDVVERIIREWLR